MTDAIFQRNMTKLLPLGKNLFLSSRPARMLTQVSLLEAFAISNGLISVSDLASAYIISPG